MRLKASEPMITAVCTMLTQVENETSISDNNLAILHDSKALAQLEESLKANTGETTTEINQDKILTKSGKAIEKEILEKMGAPQ